MNETNRKLLENFDDEVRDKLKVRDADAKVYLDRFEKTLMRITQHELSDHANFVNGATFNLEAHPSWTSPAQVPLGLYELPGRTGEAHFYRLTHPLGEAVVSRAKLRQLEPAEVIFDYNAYEGTVAMLKPYVGQSGWIVCAQLSVEALDTSEDHILLVGRQDPAHGGADLPPAVIARILSLPAKSGAVWNSADLIENDAQHQLNNAQATIQGEITERNAAFFSTEADKLDGWADDLKVGLEREIKELDRQIKEVRRSATAALGLEQKLSAQKQIKSLEATRNIRRRNLFDAQDEIDKNRNELIEKIEGKLKQQVKLNQLFCVRWRLV